MSIVAEQAQPQVAEASDGSSFGSPGGAARSPGSLKLLGGSLAIGVSATTTFIASAFFEVRPIDRGLGSLDPPYVGVYGIPVAAFLGWRLAVGTATPSWQGVSARAALMGLAAVILGAYEVVILWLVLDLPRVGLQDLPALAYALIAFPWLGVAYVGWAVLPLTLICAFVWSALLRLVVRAC